MQQNIFGLDHGKIMRRMVISATKNKPTDTSLYRVTEDSSKPLKIVDISKTELHKLFKQNEIERKRKLKVEKQNHLEMLMASEESECDIESNGEVEYNSENYEYDDDYDNYK